MVVSNCVCLVSTPGTWNDKQKDTLLTKFVAFLNKNGIQGKYVDCIPGWGCQSQDWYQFQTDIIPSYGWASLADVDEDKWEPWLTHLKEGHLLLYIQVIDKEKLVPYQ